MNEREALKPCPFCGSEPNFQEHPSFGYRWFCDFGYDHAVFIGGETPEEAAANWNRRAAPADTVEPKDWLDRAEADTMIFSAASHDCSAAAAARKLLMAQSKQRNRDLGT